MTSLRFPTAIAALLAFAEGHRVHRIEAPAGLPRRERWRYDGALTVAPQ